MSKASKKRRSKLIIAVVVLSIVLALLVGVLILLEIRDMKGDIIPTKPESTEQIQDTQGQEPTEGLTQQDPTEGTENPEQATSGETEPIPEETTEPANEEVYHNGDIITPYLTLHYPEELADHLVVVKHEGDPFILEFYAVLEEDREHRLFDLYMGPRANGNLGKIKTDSGEIPVGMMLYLFEPDDTWTQGEINTIYAMQDVANDILEQLPLIQEPAATEAPAISQTTPESSIVTFTEIDTPFCILQYPNTWEEYLQLEALDEEGVHKMLFYGKLEGREKQLLFAIYFGGDEGEQLGVIKTDSGEYVTVNIEFAELNLDGWSDNEVTILYAMQEAANQMIEEIPLL